MRGLDERQEKPQKQLAESNNMINTNSKLRRQRRIRSKISGTQERPRLCVARSNKYISVQLINDETGTTLLSVSENTIKDIKGTKTDKAKALGIYVAKVAKEKKIKQAVFDRGSYRYHGRVKAVADGVREGGVQI